jgi:FKBP-type peptidyl-prolyl cis-trans isomerase
MIKKTLFILLALFGFIAFYSCEKEIDEREADELLRFEAFMSVNYPQAIKTASGMYYIIKEEGVGEYPVKDDYLLYNFAAMNLNEDVFQTTLKTTAYLNDLYSATVHYVPTYKKYLDQDKPLIKGLIEGLSLLREGSKARFFMPSKLAYGSTSYQGLTPYTSVIFDIELTKIIKDPVAHELDLITTYINTNYPELVIDDILIDGIYFLEVLEDEPEEGGEEEEESTGPEQIVKDDIVLVTYTGRFLDNWVFDTNDRAVAVENKILNTSNSYEPIKVTVGGTGYIEGFTLALQNLKTLTYAKVIIPSKFAYKENGSGQIQPHDPLIFELTITDKVK